MLTLSLRYERERDATLNALVPCDVARSSLIVRLRYGYERDTCSLLFGRREAPTAFLMVLLEK